MIYIGIDNGKKGAIAFLNDVNLGLTQVYAQPLVGKQPDEECMRDMLTMFDKQNSCAYIEESRAMRWKNATGRTIEEKPSNAHAKGFGHGLWRGMLVAKYISCQIVPPRRWQGVMLAGESKGDGTKIASIRVAKRMFPGVSLLPTDKCRKDSDGMADALLIAEYGRRLHCGELFKQDERTD